MFTKSLSQEKDVKSQESAWERRFDFGLILYIGPSQNREVQYIRESNSTIKQVNLIGNKNNSIKLSLCIEELEFKRVVDILVEKHGCEEPFYCPGYAQKYYQFKIKSSEHLENILMTLQTVEPSISFITHKLMCSYEPTYYSSKKMAFLMGLHERAGAESAIFNVLVKNEIAEPKLITPILSFLFPVPEKTSQQKKPMDMNNYRP